MLEHEATPEIAQRSARSFWSGACLVGVLAALAFGIGLSQEPPFVDEWAYISQAYFADLWLRGETDHPLWLDYPAYDLPPLPKYVIGVALQVGGYRAPGPSDAYKWYANTSSRFGPTEMLVTARWPSVLFGALGCVAAYGLGTIGFDRRAGFLAAALLAANPLYYLHARRAMSDVVSESLILLTAWFALWAWRQILSGKSGPGAWAAMLSAGLLAGFAALAKLNGALASLTIVAWAALAVVLPRTSAFRKAAIVGGSLAAGVLSLLTFVALNPFLTAHPRQALLPGRSEVAKMSLPERARFLVAHRNGVSEQQKILFPHNAVLSLQAKIEVVAVQGFGRFGPLGPRHSDSTKRYDMIQDWGALVWIPCVLLGVTWAAVRGRRQLADGGPPTAWALLTAWFLALAVVTIYVPLAWDRYFLPLQAGSALLVSGAVSAAFEGFARAGLRDRKGV